jgi:hypothetical protein
MKIKEADYKQIEAAIDAAIEKMGIDKIRAYRAQKLGKDIEMRFRWDLLHFSGLNVVPFYNYLNDNHLDTALKQYVNSRPALNI